MNNSYDKKNFLYPYHPYRGNPQGKYTLFNAYLQNFSLKISYITNLETAGKLSSQEAYQKIESLWNDLKESRDVLEINGDFECKD